MRAGWCGFALGVIGLQRQAELPGWGGWFGLVVLGTVAIVIATWGLRGEPVPAAARSVTSAPWRPWSRYFRFDSRLREFTGWVVVWCMAACMGFGYAAVRAEMRLAVGLPQAWEGRDIEVVGSIKGLPARDEKGARFLFKVESADAPVAAFPMCCNFPGSPTMPPRRCSSRANAGV